MVSNLLGFNLFRRKESGERVRVPVFVVVVVFPDSTLESFLMGRSGDHGRLPDPGQLHRVFISSFPRRDRGLRLGCWTGDEVWAPQTTKRKEFGDFDPRRLRSVTRTLDPERTGRAYEGVEMVETTSRSGNTEEGGMRRSRQTEEWTKYRGGFLWWSIGEEGWGCGSDRQGMSLAHMRTEFGNRV